MIWGFLLGLQDQHEIKGDIFEIGVYKGRSAALLGAAVSEGACLHLVDPFKSDGFEAMMNSVSPGLQYVYHKSGSEDDSVRAEIERLAGAIRFFHIDGRHNAAFVLRELKLASRTLVQRGLICVDDFFSDRYPEVTLGAFDFLRSREDEFALVLCAFNKCYISRRTDLAFYLNQIEGSLMPAMRETGFPDFTLFRSNDPDGFNCFSIGKRYKDSDLWGPDGSQ